MVFSLDLTSVHFYLWQCPQTGNPGFTHWPTSLCCRTPALSQLRAMLSSEEVTVKGITYVNVPKNVTDNNYLRVIVKNTDSWIRLPKEGAWESLKKKKKTELPRYFCEASLESTNSPTFTTSYLYLISFIFTPRRKILSLTLLPQRKDQIKIIPIFKFLLIQKKTNKQ